MKRSGNATSEVERRGTVPNPPAQSLKTDANSDNNSRLTSLPRCGTEGQSHVRVPENNSRVRAECAVRAAPKEEFPMQVSGSHAAGFSFLVQRPTVC